MTTNPIKRIYIEGSQYYKINIEIELPKELKLKYKESIKTITLQTDSFYKNETDELFDMLLQAFGIILHKSDLTPVTFVNMFCSDKDAKLSDIPTPFTKPQGVLL